ncbi:MAG: hypothetical protein A2173_08635 [Planctomycetes bacterium RBG_13_44_8b]|nr:MAG: hypothetical protein A2173_08635 [Planctomycetes bacterium RBG_13_44_8b]
MPLHVRTIAVSIAVICFFILGFISWISGLLPFTCCKRALIGAGLAYIVTSLAVKAINAILTAAMITSRINRNLNEARSKQKGVTSEIKN